MYAIRSYYEVLHGIPEPIRASGTLAGQAQQVEIVRAGLLELRLAGGQEAQTARCHLDRFLV